MIFNRNKKFSFEKIGKNNLFYFFLIFIFVSAIQSTQKIRYFQTPTISLEPENVQTYNLDFKDSIPDNTLYQIRSKNGYPISYYRKVSTGICFDNKCRLLDIVLYWNITGRYLGFELPEGEFLSKSEHEPFVRNEYEQLNKILADSDSPLRNIAYNQLVLGPPPNSDDIDAVSSATSPAVLAHTVPGAVYTTFMLWHTIYGTTQREAEDITIKMLSPELIFKILESPNPNDMMWALNHINGYINLTPELREKIIQFIDNDNYSLSERALNSIDPNELEFASQILLLEKFHTTDYSIKRIIIDKLKEAPQLSPEVTRDLADNLRNLNGEILSRVLETFQKHNVSNKKIFHRIAPILENDNYFISKKVYDFLTNREIKDKKIEQLLRKYKKTQR